MLMLRNKESDIPDPVDILRFKVIAGKLSSLQPGPQLRAVVVGHGLLVVVNPRSENYNRLDIKLFINQIYILKNSLS